MVYCFLQLTYLGPFSKHIHRHPRKENFKCSAELFPTSYHKERSTPRINSGDDHFVGFQEEVISPKVLDCLKRISEWLARVFELVGPENPEIPKKTGIPVFCGRDGFHWHYSHVGFQRWLASIFYLFYSLPMTHQNQGSDK